MLCFSLSFKFEYFTASRPAHPTRRWHFKRQNKKNTKVLSLIRGRIFALQVIDYVVMVSCSEQTLLQSCCKRSLWLCVYFGGALWLKQRLFLAVSWPDWTLRLEVNKTGCFQWQVLYWCSCCNWEHTPLLISDLTASLLNRNISGIFY